jgi:hypothetical protein
VGSGGRVGGPILVEQARKPVFKVEAFIVDHVHLTTTRVISANMDEIYTFEVNEGNGLRLRHL